MTTAWTATVASTSGFGEGITASRTPAVKPACPWACGTATPARPPVNRPQPSWRRRLFTWRALHDGDLRQPLVLGPLVPLIVGGPDPLDGAVFGKAGGVVVHHDRRTGIQPRPGVQPQRHHRRQQPLAV